MKRGQAALEFLTTYGWAFLVVLVMIGALAYFGVLDPAKFLPEKCLFGSGIGCVDYVGNAESSGGAGDGDVLLQVVNGFGHSITVTNVQIIETGVSGTCTATCTNTDGSNYGDRWCKLAEDMSTSTMDTTWKTDEIRELEIECEGLTSSDKPRFNIIVSYQKGGSTYVKTVEGELQVKPI